MGRKDALVTDFNNATEKLSHLIVEDSFIEPITAKKALNGFIDLRNEADGISSGVLYRLGLASRPLKEACGRFMGTYDGLMDRVHEHNRRVAADHVESVRGTAGSVEGRPLDVQQLSAIAMDVDTRLVLAGAGTGKTTTVIGLAKHLVSSGMASPEEILFLSFTNATVSDLSSRIAKEIGTRADVCTFHRLGMRILAESDGKVPRVTGIDPESFVRDQLQRLMSDERYLRDLDRFMAFDSRYAADEDDFDNETDYQKFIRENPLVTLDGTVVKSMGEADIANWLFMHGIPYVYEEPYPVDTRTSEYGQYRPDFRISGTDVYIEYFGVDRQGRVAPFMRSVHGDDPSEEYRRSMEWKRETHDWNGTRLISLYAYQRSEDSLLDELEKSLRMNGVEIGSRDPSEVFSKLSDGKSLALDRVAREFSTALMLVKGSGKTVSDALSGGSGIREKRVLKRALALIGPVYEAYQRALSEKGEIDFEDMLNKAAERVSSGRYVHGYRYVVVDEYQDISGSRYRLLKSMRDSKPFRLFCVGDDWQSIYRFNGSDVGYILDFERYWGPSETCRIERTYRFSGDLLRVSNEFMNSAPGQMKKELVGDSGSNSRLVILKGNSPSSCARSVARALDSIRDDESVLFLGRFRHDIVSLENGGFRWRPDPNGRTYTVVRTDTGRQCTFMTIHGSKGMQADHVFVLNNRKGSGGFPDMRGESVLIRSLLVSHGDKLDDERRLFYVAITRARKAAYLVTLKGSESEYVEFCDIRLR